MKTLGPIEEALAVMKRINDAGYEGEEAAAILLASTLIKLKDDMREVFQSIEMTLRGNG